MEELVAQIFDLPPTHSLTRGPLNGPLDEGRLRRCQSGVFGPVGARGHPDPQHGRARVGHDRLDVGKINIDEPGYSDDVRDALGMRFRVDIVSESLPFSS